MCSYCHFLHLSVSYLFAFSYCSWGSQGKNTEVVCHSLLQWTTFCHTSPDNHDGVITHLEPDILKCEGKWALGSITMNKASGGDGIPVELFQILKDDAMKVLHSICQQIWKLSSGHRNGKVSFHSNPKESPCQKMFKLLHNCTHLTC